LGISDGLNAMQGVKYSFEEINGGTRFDMAKQFGESGVKAYLYEKKYQSGDSSIKDSKEYQQNLLAKSLGFTNYREMGEALKKGKISKNDVRDKFKELEDAGELNPENFAVEKKETLKDQVENIKKYSDPRSTFTRRNDIQQKLLTNEINAYAKEQGYVDKNDNGDGLLFLEAVDSGDYRDSRAESLIDRYKSTFEELGYMGTSYDAFKNSNGLNSSGEYTVDNISDRIRKRF